MEKKEEKKGFWGSMFGSQSGSCCGSMQIEEVDEAPNKQQETEDNVQPEEKKAEIEQKPKEFPSCGCGGCC